MLNTNEKRELYIHYILCLTGGFMGAYSIINRSGIFGSAQTANLICSVLDLTQGNLGSLLLRLTALFLFILPMMAAVILPRLYHINLPLFCILLELIVTVALGLLPENIHPMIALYPVCFIMSLQWCTFSSIKGYLCSTIFSTNNLRQFISALCEYRLEKDKKHLEKAKVYGETLLFYHLGVGAAALSSPYLGIRSIWICLIPLSLSLTQLR